MIHEALNRFDESDSTMLLVGLAAVGVLILLLIAATVPLIRAEFRVARERKMWAKVHEVGDILADRAVVARQEENHDA